MKYILKCLKGLTKYPELQKDKLPQGGDRGQEVKEGTGFSRREG